MRILHTSDWHAGRVWRGTIGRLPELQDILEHLGDFVEREKIDLLLMSGDVFDHTAPSAEAERAVFRFFKRIGQAGVPSVVIAGNHDNPARLDAWGLLAELVQVRALGLPQGPDKGGVIRIETRGGERATVAAVPFAPVERIITALELADDETKARQHYADVIQTMFARLAASFAPDAVNLLMGHTHLAGAKPGGSERAVHIGDDWAATAQAIPASAHYAALGHIHRPQVVEAAAVPTRYAGSPMQLDFGEVADSKHFVVVDARAGQPVRIEEVPYSGAVRLSDAAGTLAEIERDAGALRNAGHLRVTVRLTTPDPEVSRTVRRLLPNAVVVRTELPEPEEGAAAAARVVTGVPPREVFNAYHRREHQRDASEASLALFDELYSQAGGE